VKKIEYRPRRRTQGPPAKHKAWDFGVAGLALYKRPDDNKASWNIIHLPSGLAVIVGERTRDDAMRALLRFPPIDWSLSALEVCLQLDMGYDGRCVEIEVVA
jgi:hypothetical protein